MKRDVYASGGWDWNAAIAYSDTMQLSTLDTIRVSAQEGAISSFGLGTVLRDAQIPAGVQRFESVEKGQFPSGTPRTDEEMQALGAIDEQTYKASPYYRPDIPYDPGMTLDRAKALAAWRDARQVRQERLQQTDGWVAKLVGSVAGQALDPINYIPIFGEVAVGAAAAKIGMSTFAARALIGGADAAANTAIFGALTAPARAQYGDDVSFQTQMLDVATAAFIGTVFGAGIGATETIKLRRQAKALRELQATHAALNDAVESLTLDGEVKLRADTIDRLAKIAATENPEQRADLFAPATDPRGLSPTDTLGRIVDNRPAAVSEFGAFLRREALASDPELKSRFDAATEKLAAAEQKLADIEAPLQKRTDADAAALIDPASADHIRAIDEELAASPPPARRAALEAERSLVIENLGPAAIAKAEGDFRIGPEKQAKQARKAVAAARQELNRVRSEADNLAKAKLAVNRALYRPKTDPTPPAPADVAPNLPEAAAKVGRPAKDLTELAKDFGIDIESGNFSELDEVALLDQQGRLDEADKALLADATEISARSKVYADAMKQAVLCGLN